MAALPPLLTEGLPIRRLGVVTQATATIWRDDTDPYAADKPEFHLVPVTFPAEIPMEGGWRLQHASPTTGQPVTQNWLVELFHGPRAHNLRLHPSDLGNITLLESIAAAFTNRSPTGYRADGSLGTAEGNALLPGGTPYLTYYCPLEAPDQQYLLLYQDNLAPGERATEKPSYTFLYALIQVELNESHFIFLLRQALEAADSAR